MCCVFSAGKGEGWAGRRRRKEGGKWISPPPFRHCKKGDVTSALVLFHPLFTIRYFPPLPPVHPVRNVCLSDYVRSFFCQGFWLSPARCIETLPSFLSAFFWAREREGGNSPSSAFLIRSPSFAWEEEAPLPSFTLLLLLLSLGRRERLFCGEVTVLEGESSGCGCDGVCIDNSARADKPPPPPPPQPRPTLTSPHFGKKRERSRGRRH